MIDRVYILLCTEYYKKALKHSLQYDQLMLNVIDTLFPVHVADYELLIDGIIDTFN